MELNLKENTISLAGNPEKLDYKKSVETLVKLDSQAVAGFLSERGGLPREIRMNALRSCINDFIVVAKELSLTDEVMYRLNWYPKFSDFQLINFFNILVSTNGERFDIGSQNAKFKKNFYTLLLQNWKALGLFDDDFNTLLALPQKAGEAFEQWNANLDPAFYDYLYNIDGLSYEDFKSSLIKSATVVEIRSLAAKYDIAVPKRLRKEQLVALVLEGIRRQGKYSDGIEVKLNKMSAIALQRYAKDNKINASTELKKSEVVEFIMNRLETAPKVVQKQRVSLTDLEENKLFVFDKSYLREVKVKVEAEDFDDEPIVEEVPVKEEVKVEPTPAPVVEPTPAPEVKVEPTPVVEPIVTPQVVATPMFAPSSEPIKIVVEHHEEPKPENEARTVNVEPLYRDGYSDELIATITKILEQRDSRDTIQELLEDNRFTSVIKLYEERIKYLEKLVNDLINRPVQTVTTVQAQIPQTTNANQIVTQEEEDTMNNDEVKETEGVETIVVNASLDNLTAGELKDLDAKKELTLEQEEIKESKESKKLQKKQDELNKMREANERQAYKRMRRKHASKIFWSIFWTIVLVYVAFIVVGTLATLNIFGATSVQINAICNYVPGIKYCSQGIVKLISMISGMFKK